MVRGGLLHQWTQRSTSAASSSMLLGCSVPMLLPFLRRYASSCTARSSLSPSWFRAWRWSRCPVSRATAIAACRVEGVSGSTGSTLPGLVPGRWRPSGGGLSPAQRKSGNFPGRSSCRWWTPRFTWTPSTRTSCVCSWTGPMTWCLSRFSCMPGRCGLGPLGAGAIPGWCPIGAQGLYASRPGLLQCWWFGTRKHGEDMFSYLHAHGVVCRPATSVSDVMAPFAMPVKSSSPIVCPAFSGRLRIEVQPPGAVGKPACAEPWRLICCLASTVLVVLLCPPRVSAATAIRLPAAPGPSDEVESAAWSTKVAEWRRLHKMEDDGDFAFCFTDADQARAHGPWLLFHWVEVARWLIGADENPHLTGLKLAWLDLNSLPCAVGAGPLGGPKPHRAAPRKPLRKPVPGPTCASSATMG